MKKFKVVFYLPTGGSDTSIIKCRECTISESAYTFWSGEIGETKQID